MSHWIQVYFAGEVYDVYQQNGCAGRVFYLDFEAIDRLLLERE